MRQKRSGESTNGRQLTTLVPIILDILQNQSNANVQSYQCYQWIQVLVHSAKQNFDELRLMFRDRENEVHPRLFADPVRRRINEAALHVMYMK